MRILRVTEIERGGEKSESLGRTNQTPQPGFLGVIPLAKWSSCCPLEPKVKEGIKAVKLLHPDGPFTVLGRAEGMSQSSV